MKYKVGVSKLNDLTGTPLNWNFPDIESLKTSLHNTLNSIGYAPKEVKSQTVLLHPNLVRPHPQRPASFTDPRVIIALAMLFRDYGASKVEVGENPGFGFSSRAAFKEARLDSVLLKEGFGIRYFDEEEWVTRDNPRGRLYRQVKVAKSVLDADVFINIPKLKTHMLTGVSLSVKNLLGIIHDEDRQIFHRNDIADKVVDLHFVRSPDLNVIDGLWAMEGQAPFHGNAIENFNVILAGREAVAVDVAACQIMGFRPEEIPHVQLGCKRLLSEWKGIDNLQLIGDDPIDFSRNFKRPILSSMGQFQGVDTIECGVCNGCLSAVRHSLDWLRATGDLDMIDDITIVSGRAMPNRNTLETWNGELILFGNCATEFQFFDHERRQKCTWIPGCAPHVLDLAKLISEKFHK